MAAMIAIPGNTWTRLPGTEWEVFQNSGEVVFLGDSDAVVHIRRAAEPPRVWGPRPCVAIEPGSGITR